MIRLPVHPNYETLISEYENHARDVVGVQPGTLYNRSLQARKFLRYLSDQGIHEIDLVTPSHVISYMEEVTKKYKRSTAGQSSTTLRAFFLYWRLRGIGHKKLADSAPRFKSFRLKNIPTYLNKEQEEKFLKAFDRKSRSGKRNYAMGVLLLRLGLRAIEVRALTLDDIKWREGIVLIRNKKCRRVDTLPLLPEVGKALTDYIKNVRPESTYREVFLNLRNRKNTPLGRGTIGTSIQKQLAQFGVALPNKGTHLLRRTVASRMIQNGASIKEIADVLRHRDIDTPIIYTKINIPLLSQVSMPWPVSFFGVAGGAK